MQSSAATADADPPEEPPGTSIVLEPSRRHGLTTGPKQEVSFDEAVTGLGDGQRCQIGHLLIGLQKNGESVLSLAGSSLFGRVRSLASSASSTASTALSGSAALPCRSIASR